MTYQGTTFHTHETNYNVLDKWSSPDWDDQTREVVLRLVEEIPPIRFFTDEEARLLDAVAQRIVPQPDRSEAEGISTGVNPSLPIDAIAARLSSH